MDQQGTGKWIHLTTATSTALRAWVNAAHISDGLVFRGIRSSGAITKGLCESRISRIYKTLARKAGFKETIIQRISGHSMRVGGAHDLLILGASLPQIMVKGGWAKTDTVMRYVKRVQQPISGKTTFPLRAVDTDE
jgi:hypothetical protein